MGVGRANRFRGRFSLIGTGAILDFVLDGQRQTGSIDKQNFPNWQCPKVGNMRMLRSLDVMNEWIGCRDE
jgi:hypothetical protein